MEEKRASQPPPQPAAAAAVDSGCTIASSTNATTRKRQEGSTSSALSQAKKDCTSFTVSLQEGFRYLKALLLGQAKKLAARNEREATEADMKTYKMQVDAADAAEDAKKKLDKTAQHL